MWGRTWILGLVTGLGIPFFSNIVPIRMALASNLRNGLDKMRPSTDDIEVQMVRYEQAGLSAT